MLSDATLKLLNSLLDDKAIIIQRVLDKWQIEKGCGYDLFVADLAAVEQARNELRSLAPESDVASKTRNTPNTGGWNEHSRFYGTE